ncbi:hypothetical protein B484DRAFT_449334 [Ochromonadaceae sp. CCMP2298]|nr:hypothetical protein B484DRAFT_449334 [Ochromonadaceae sp. CCMP2298]
MRLFRSATALVGLVLLSCAAVSIAGKVSFSEALELVGRFNVSGGVYRADWPYSGFRFGFQGDDGVSLVSVTFTECDECNYYVEALLDGAYVLQKFLISPASTEIELGLPEGYHQVTFRKVTEASNGDARGIMALAGVSLQGAVFVSKEEGHFPRRSKMLVIGDSISAAYGVDGDDPCTFSAQTENAAHSYASLTASAVGADLHLVAWSGKGVVRNYGDPNTTSSNPMPTYYNRTLGNGPSASASASASMDNYWDPSLFPADVVLVMLGSNDYSTQPNPSDASFTQALAALLQQIHKDYPSARVAAACAPSAQGSQCQNIEAAAMQNDARYIFVTPDCYTGGYGCDGHPSALTQQNISAVIIPVVQEMLALRS